VPVRQAAPVVTTTCSRHVPVARLGVHDPSRNRQSVARTGGAHPSRFPPRSSVLRSDRPVALPPPPELAWVAHISARKTTGGGRAATGSPNYPSRVTRAQKRTVCRYDSPGGFQLTQVSSATGASKRCPPCGSFLAVAVCSISIKMLPVLSRQTPCNSARSGRTNRITTEHKQCLGGPRLQGRIRGGL